ncbi:MAG: DUF3426 domain-containing protein [Mariprofundaceae bacterium]|nr:DUF3426 domain-containing protein [Mariprofundaceae bacterium]
MTCPKCQATYELKHDVQHALLVCHRCKSEFTTDDIPVIEKPVPSSDSMYLASKRKKTRIWPWLTVVLLIVASFGMQYNQDIWIQQAQIRNILAQLHYPMQAQASDWLILRNQSHRQWVTRQDGSKVLVLTGSIQNRLNAAQQLPQLTIHFYESANTRPIQSITTFITMPPSLPDIRHAPYIQPDIDRTPMKGYEKRDFTLVFEHVPEHSREFSIEVSLK